MPRDRCPFLAACLAAAFALPWGGLRAESPPPLVLAEEGRAAARVVLPDEAGRRSPEERVAELLVSAFRAAADAELPVLRESDLGAVRVEGGRIVAEAPPAYGDGPPPPVYLLLGETELAARLGIDGEGLGVGGMRLAVSGNAVVLLGGPEGGGAHRDDGGLRYAAIELLEQLGFRWLWPGELGTVVPQGGRVALAPVDIAYTPPIGRRGLRGGTYGIRPGDAPRALEPLGIGWEEWDRIRSEAERGPLAATWREWQRLGGEMPNFGHGGAGLRDAERALREHPEWFALQKDGTRDQGGIARWRLCKSNTDLIAHVAEDVIRQREEDPSLVLVSLCPNDGGYSSWCLCEGCRALDPPHGPPETLLRFERAGSSRREPMDYVSLSDRKVFYWNSVAERVAEVHPDLLFGVSAYSRFNRPPVERRLHPNLVVRYVRNDHEGWLGWKEAGARSIFWRPNILLLNRRHGKLQSIVRELADHMGFFSEHGMTMTDISSVTNHWATFGLSYYAAARLNWNPRLTAGEIIADYARHGFGAGAPAIERYFHLVEDLTEAGARALDEEEGDEGEAEGGEEAFAALHALLDEADAAAGDATVSARVAFLRHGLNFTQLQEALDEKARRAESGEPVDAERAALLVDLNGLVLRDLLRRHPLAVNVPGLVRESSEFARWQRIGGRRVSVSDERLLERLADPACGVTGEERGVDDLLRAFGMADGAGL